MSDTPSSRRRECRFPFHFRFSFQVSIRSWNAKTKMTPKGYMVDISSLWVTYCRCWVGVKECDWLIGSGWLDGSANCITLSAGTGRFGGGGVELELALTRFISRLHAATFIFISPGFGPFWRKIFFCLNYRFFRPQTGTSYRYHCFYDNDKYCCNSTVNRIRLPKQM